MSRRIAGLVALACATMLAACGGGEDPGDAAARPAQPTATAAVTTRATSTPAPPSEITHAERVAKLRPPIVDKPIPLTDKRKHEMVEYADRHYGIRSATITRPKVIVEHYTVTPDVQSTYDVFAPDEPDVELHELPGLCSQFVVDRDGTIYQLTPLSFMCRHTVGLNYTALGIEHVGSSDQEVLSNPAQMRASLRLTRWLRCRSHIPVKNVIGHSESRSSPYHHENVARLRSQTHADWTRADMEIYRGKLAAQGSCPR
jgi:beta-N-acetylhexosaminidase